MSVTIDADPRYVKFGLRTECPACGAHLPVNGPAPEVDCADCGQRTAVPRDLLVGLLRDAEERWPRGEADTVTLGDITWRFTREPVEAPACPACDAELPRDWPVDAPLACPSCRAEVPSEAPPGWLARAAPTGTRILGGELDQTRDGQPERPVALQCPSCGAGLSITHRHQRLTPCDRCGSNVHIPDAVWRALHPPRTVRPWTLRFDGESVPARRAREQAEAAARKAAEAEQAKKNRAEKERRKQEEAERLAQKNAAARAAWEEEQAAQARRRLLWSLPLKLIAWGLTLGTTGAAALTTVWVLIGRGPWLRSIGLNNLSASLLADFLLVATGALALVTWVFGVFAATRRAGTGFGEVLPWAGFMVFLSVLPGIGPVFGLMFAWQHAIGKEPTVGTDVRLPAGAAWHLALLHLVLSGFAQVVFFAATSTGVAVWAR